MTARYSNRMQTARATRQRKQERLADGAAGPDTVVPPTPLPYPAPSPEVQVIGPSGAVVVSHNAAGTETRQKSGKKRDGGWWEDAE